MMRTQTHTTRCEHQWDQMDGVCFFLETERNTENSNNNDNAKQK